MDRNKALALEQQLKGRMIRDLKVVELIDNGKSAAVFKAKKNEITFALKIFDNELVERFGHEIQVKRIEQEISLKDHSINNLVKIYDGGETTVGNQTFYYITMEFMEGLNLKDYIQTNNYNEEFIIKILDKLTNTAEQLLTQKRIVHRDIKPENIMVRNDGEIILMDLGVLKLIGAKSFSDEEEKSFVGTLRYAPPEFLLRTEEDTENGWRGVNIYQIGATLHDLIMKEELFKDKTPYANLVIAIKDDMPKISNNLYTYELQQLTRNMVTKDWKRRLLLVPKEKIDKIVTIKNNYDNVFEKEVDEVLKMRLGHEAKFAEIEKLQRTKQELRQKQIEISLKLTKMINACFEKIKSKGIFTSFEKSENFLFDDDRRQNDSLIQNYLYEIQGELKMGFPRNLFILVRMSNDADYYSEIELLGIFPSPITRPSIKDPLFVFQELAKDKQKLTPHNQHYNLKTITIFKGIAEFDDSFSNNLSSQIVKLISKALKGVEKIVEEELQMREDFAKSKQGFNSRVTTVAKNIIIDTL